MGQRLKHHVYLDNPIPIAGGQSKMLGRVCAWVYGNVPAMVVAHFLFYGSHIQQMHKQGVKQRRMLEMASGRANQAPNGEAMEEARLAMV